MVESSESTTSEDGGKPEKPARSTRSSKHNEVYQRIVRALLSHEALGCGDIADQSGYGKKGDSRHSYVRRQVKELYTGKQYLEREPDPSLNRFRIKRDLAVVQEIFNDEIYAPIRSDFQQSMWLRELIVRTCFPTFRNDKIFLDHLRLMVGSSRLMFESCLRGDFSTALKETEDAVLADPLPTLVNVPGINQLLFKAARRKCRVYDLYLAWILAENQDAFSADLVPGELARVIEKMRHASASLKRAALNYAVAYAGVQNMVRYVEALRIKGDPPTPLFPDLVQRYNVLIGRLSPTVADYETLEVAAQSMKVLFQKTSRELDKITPVDAKTGLITLSGSITAKVPTPATLPLEDEGKTHEEKEGTD